jgi:hypothetical protein
LSYSKVRALTRVAQMHDEDLLLAYALDATVSQVEERCRQIRNVAPDSVDHARRAWENRSLTMWRDEGRGLMRFTVEVPIEDGELLVRALECAIAGGEVSTDLDPDAISESKGTAWCAQQADALVAVAKSYLDGGQAPEGGATADHYGFSIVKDADDTLRFLTADGRTIPRCGYRLEDFVDDDIGESENTDPNASRDGFCTTTVQRREERAEVREPAAVYHIRRITSAMSAC